MQGRAMSLRLCFWRAQDCGGVICQRDGREDKQQCQLRRFSYDDAVDSGWFRNEVGAGDFLAKRLDAPECAPFLQWRKLPGQQFPPRRSWKR